MVIIFQKLEAPILYKNSLFKILDIIYIIFENFRPAKVCQTIHILKWFDKGF